MTFFAKMNQDKTQYIVTARKWRPNRFEEVVGQEHITTTLRNSIRSKRIHHAYLFCGPRGVGKTTSARIFARAVNCPNLDENFEPCNKCDSCISILDARSLDVIEIDGASNNSVDDIRKLRENAKYPPSSGKYKMYIIDEVHMLSTSAFNALLKTLEEPPPHLLFVFATTESHKVPPTIISRCQRFDFRRMEIRDIVGQLKYIAKHENLEIDDDALFSIAKKGDGSMRDSQSIFDQAIAFCGKHITYADLSNALHLVDEDFYFTISDAVRSKDIGKMFQIAGEFIARGYDITECLRGLLEHFRHLLAIKVTGDGKLIDGSEQTIQRYISSADGFAKTDLIRYLNLIANAEKEIKFSPQPRVRFELSLVQLASMDSSVEINTLIKEIQGLASANGNGAEVKKKL